MKKIALIFLSLLMLVSLAAPAFAAGEEGMTFSAEKTHPISGKLEKAPVTFEAVVRIPKGYTERAGLILSSYSVGATKSNQDGITFQFNSSKQLELYYETADTKTVRHKFTEIPVTAVATGEWVHIAIVKDDAAGKAHAYINGEFVQTSDTAPKTYGYLENGKEPLAFCVGGDHRSGNNVFFKGEIREIAMFSDIRTADEIKADAKGLKADKDMLVWLQLSKGDLAAKDLSGNGHHMGDYKEPETTKASTTAATTKAPATKPTAPATFDAAVVLAVVASVAGAGTVVLKKKR